MDAIRSLHCLDLLAGLLQLLVASFDAAFDPDCVVCGQQLGGVGFQGAANNGAVDGLGLGHQHAEQMAAPGQIEYIETIEDNEPQARVLRDGQGQHPANQWWPEWTVGNNKWWNVKGARCAEARDLLQPNVSQTFEGVATDQGGPWPPK